MFVGHLGTFIGTCEIHKPFNIFVGRAYDMYLFFNLHGFKDLFCYVRPLGSQSLIGYCVFIFIPQ